MYDMFDSLISPRNLGRIFAEPARLAEEAVEAVTTFRVPTTVFIDPEGTVFAQPTAYAADHVMDEIVGIYAPGIRLDDIADDLRASVAPRLAAIGILVNWQDACHPA
ncbi:MAG TPA: hypothetical protein VFS55_07130 [Dokdonella sp.]|nr:hypothetical protein [Dokdonella sp.]